MLNVLLLDGLALSRLEHERDFCKFVPISLRVGFGVSVDFKMYLLFTCAILAREQKKNNHRTELAEEETAILTKYLFQFNIIFASPNCIYECKFNQTTENEEATSQKPDLRHLNVAHFGQGFALCR